MLQLCPNLTVSHDAMRHPLISIASYSGELYQREESWDGIFLSGKDLLDGHSPIVRQSSDVFLDDGDRRCVLTLDYQLQRRQRSSHNQIGHHDLTNDLTSFFLKSQIVVAPVKVFRKKYFCSTLVSSRRGGTSGKMALIHSWMTPSCTFPVREEDKCVRGERRRRRRSKKVEEEEV